MSLMHLASMPANAMMTCLELGRHGPQVVYLCILLVLVLIECEVMEHDGEVIHGTSHMWAQCTITMVLECQVECERKWHVAV